MTGDFLRQFGLEVLQTDLVLQDMQMFTQTLSHLLSRGILQKTPTGKYCSNVYF